MVILKDTLTFSPGLTLVGFIIRDAAANAAGCGVLTVVDVVSGVVAVEVETGVVVVTSDVLVVRSCICVCSGGCGSRCGWCGRRCCHRSTTGIGKSDIRIAPLGIRVRNVYIGGAGRASRSGRCNGYYHSLQ